MGDQNKIQTIAGRLGKDPVLYQRNMEKGVCPVAKFSMACEHMGENGAETVWFQCSAWDKRSDVVMKHLRKGDSAQLHGFASRENYTDRNGNAQTALCFNVMYVTFLGKAKVNQEQPAQAAQANDAPIPGVTTVEDQDPF